MSSQLRRMIEGGYIDRSRPLTFSFDGRTYSGYQGDTLASGLLANNVSLVGRSFKLHRPRGIFSAGAEEPNALVQVGVGANTSPNLRATQVELFDGLEAFSINAWPSLDIDFWSINDFFAPLLPAGFYYKTFMWPKSLWHTYERIIRGAAGLGRAPEKPDPDTYDHMHLHCDVLVVGAGPCGLSAGLQAAKSGARVVIADEQSEVGGQLLGNGEQVEGIPGREWAREVMGQLKELDVNVLLRTTAMGHYDHNYVIMLQRRKDHLKAFNGPGSRQRLWKVRAGQIFLATGAHERSIVFKNNDRPGIMQASAALAYMNRYAVKVGRRAVVFTNNDSGYAAASRLNQGGIEVISIIDPRHERSESAEKLANFQGIKILNGYCVLNSKGRKRLTGVTVAPVNHHGIVSNKGWVEVGCDLLAVSGGWNPCVHLHCHSGGKLRFDSRQACFTPSKSNSAVRSAGAAAGIFDLKGCLKSGSEIGTDYGKQVKNNLYDFSQTKTNFSETVHGTTMPLLWVKSSSRGDKSEAFVDLQYDVTASDICLAVNEGYSAVEHLKRYTALGMATDQGKTSNILGLAVLSDILGQPISEIGVTTFRPPYTAVTLGALAGRSVGAFFDPIRRTPIHQWHEREGAIFEDVGQWKRPLYYPQNGESMSTSVSRECKAARCSAGIFDASTLGKIDIQGRDAITLLNRVYINDWESLAVGRSRYGVMCGEDGMVFDDGVTTRLGEYHYLMSTTTVGAERVLRWLEEWLQTEWPDLHVNLTSVTEQWATIGVCGPNARKILAKLVDGAILQKDKLPFMAALEVEISGIPARIFRISFSGEISFEINVAARHGLELWESLIAAGQPHGLTAYGTETMHVLRAEKGYIIVGQETDGTITPIDLGLGRMVSKKKDFIGKRSLSRPDCLRQDRKQLVGLLSLDETQVLPEGSQILEDTLRRESAEMIGHITSSYYSPNIGRSIALALIKGGRSRLGETVHVSSANRRFSAQIVEPIFLDPFGLVLRG